MKKLKSNFEGKLLSKTQMKGIGGGSGWLCVCPNGAYSIFVSDSTDFNSVYPQVLSFCGNEAGTVNCETMWE